MNISLKILLVYMGLNFLGIFLSAVFGIWFLTSGILWLFFMGAVFLWPFWWLIEIIKFGDIIKHFWVRKPYMLCSKYCFDRYFILYHKKQ